MGPTRPFRSAVHLAPLPPYLRATPHPFLMRQGRPEVVSLCPSVVNVAGSRREAYALLCHNRMRRTNED